MKARDALAGAGGVFVVAGAAGLAGYAVPGLNATYAFVLAVGALAGLQGLRYALRRRRADVIQTTTGDPERRYRVPAPGDDVDRDMSLPGGWRGSSSASAVRKRIYDAAVRTLVLRDNCSESEAETRIEEGTWTDDPIAANYLGADVAVPLRTRLRILLSGRVSTVRAARAIAAVEALRASDDGPTTPRVGEFR
jgi:hypothetical protein